MPESKPRRLQISGAPIASVSSRFVVPAEEAGRRLDQFLATAIADVSRNRVQQLIAADQVLVNDKKQKPSYLVERGDAVAILGDLKAPPLKAEAEDIPLDVVYEDDSLAVINKPAGMTVHAGAGASDQVRNRGTLVNALLYHFRNLSRLGGELRPGIVHRLDKETSGLILVAKNDAAHRKLAEQFSGRKVKKKYLALVQGWPRAEHGTITSAIGRDRARRTRMTTRVRQGREAVSHYKVLERRRTLWGKFALLEVTIDTGRTHQIRVHLASLGHPVVGDALYGAAREYKSQTRRTGSVRTLRPPPRNFLHAAEIGFLHPRTAKRLSFRSGLPSELEDFLAALDQGAVE
jgi:23S rRNA pseudouridine1911/1915/1917 synthase